MRGDLVSLLHQATDAGVEHRFGDCIVDLRPDDDGVTVDLDHAGSRRFELVIGADGLHSTVRRLAFGPDARFLRHRDHYFAFANADAELGEDRWVTMYNRPGRMAGIYRSGSHPQAKAYFVFRSGPQAFDHTDIEQHRRLLRDAFAGDASWRIPELLATALADPDLYVDALSQVDLDTWSIRAGGARGRRRLVRIARLRRGGGTRARRRVPPRRRTGRRWRGPSGRLPPLPARPSRTGPAEAADRSQPVHDGAQDLRRSVDARPARPATADADARRPATPRAGQRRYVAALRPRGSHANATLEQVSGEHDGARRGLSTVDPLEQQLGRGPGRTPAGRRRPPSAGAASGGTARSRRSRPGRRRCPGATAPAARRR